MHWAAGGGRDKMRIKQSIPLSEQNVQWGTSCSEVKQLQVTPNLRGQHGVAFLT